MKIHTYEVGPTHPVFIVAEGGSNHGGSLEAALALTDAAADAGANGMKWQLWLSADEMYDKEQFPKEWETTEKYRLPLAWLPALRDRAYERGMAFGLSSFGLASLAVADEVVDFHKIASIESQWHQFVVAVVDKGKPILASLGMRESDIAGFDVMDVPYVVLECAVAYPLALEESNLRAHPYGRYGWGLSDHTTHPTIAPCAAVALGACVIEKHIKLDKPDLRPLHERGLSAHIVGGTLVLGGPKDLTPDWNHSLDQHSFKDMVEAIRLTEQALGSSEKRIRPSEEPYLKYRRGPKGLRGA